MIEISPEIKPGQCTFEIGLEINGKDYGTIPCTIEVISESYPGNHGITSIRATPEPSDNITRSSPLMIKLTMDDLIEKSDAIVIGKVVDIFPARQVDIDVRHWIVITDVVIEVERYLYGQPRSRYIAIMVQGGRVEQTFVWVEDQPEFNLGDGAALFLNPPELDILPPDGFEDTEFYMAAGAMQGKLGYKNGHMVKLWAKL